MRAILKKISNLFLGNLVNLGPIDESCEIMWKPITIPLKSELFYRISVLLFTMINPIRQRIIGVTINRMDVIRVKNGSIEIFNNKIQLKVVLRIQLWLLLLLHYYI